MARTPLTLAALATSAVSGLDVVSASAFGSGSDGDFESALVTLWDGSHRLVRIPRSERAEQEQSEDLVALRALSVGVRSRLPFTVSTYAGQTPVGGTRAVVYEFIYGAKRSLDSIDSDLAASVGRAMAAIHTLPTSFVADAGLPVLSAVDILRGLITMMDRASATGLVPAALLGRWERASEDSALWQFAPTVVNGSISVDSFLCADGAVAGVLGWNSLSVGDPACDLYWALSIPQPEMGNTVFDAYAAARGASDRQLRQRSMLYSELEIAKWLLHGAQERDVKIIDDAVEMLQGLSDSVRDDLDQTLTHNTIPTMAVTDVEAMLDRERRF